MQYFLQQKYIGSGSWCKVYDIGHDVCLKLYREKSIASIAYSNACVAEKNGIGPKVYGRTDYGYYTEIVRVAEPEDIGTCYPHDEINADHWFAILVTKVFGCGPLRDLHCANVGIADDGNLLMIDFETEFWYDKPDDE